MIHIHCTIVCCWGFWLALFLCFVVTQMFVDVEYIRRLEL